MPLKNFDIYVGIDWSGAFSPFKNLALALASCPAGTKAPQLVWPPDNGYWSRTAVAGFLENCALHSSGHRYLVGIDCNFGYASSVLRACHPDMATAENLWRAVDETCRDAPDFYAGPYTERSPASSYFWRNGRLPPNFPPGRRLTETICGQGGYGWPESPFKLIGVKQVGKGGLAGMRMLSTLRKRLGEDIAVWPFDPEERLNKARIVITEIFPRQFMRRAGHGPGKIRTWEELNTALVSLGSEKTRNSGIISDHAADALISAAGLRCLCNKGAHVPENVSRPFGMTEEAALREGWIFGAGDQRLPT